MKRFFSSPAMHFVASHARRQFFPLLLLIVLNMLIATLSVLCAWACKGVVDAAVSGNAVALKSYIFLIAFLIASTLLLTVFNRYLSETTTINLYLSIQEQTIRSLLGKEFSCIAGFHSGELLNRLVSDVHIIAGGVTGILPSFAHLIARLVGAGVTLFILAPRFTLLFLVAGVLIFLSMTFLRERIKQIHKDHQAADGRMRSFIQETMERLLVIKVFDAGHSVCEKIRTFQGDYKRTLLKSHAVSIVSNAGIGLIFDLGYFGALVWSCIGLYRHTITYGTMTAMLQLVGQIQQPFSGFSHLFSRAFVVAASAERILEFASLPDEEKQPEVSYEALRSIRLNHADFTYGRTDVLRGVDVTINKGDFVSVTGISGGGKSTLFLLLLGAYQPTAGDIRFEFAGQDSAVPPGNALRRLCAYVPQGNALMSGTLRENLTFYRGDADTQAIWQALEQACAADFVRELPQGLETLLGEKGHGLSEGQMQRIAIARALLSGAPILLLDEATSALDEATEAQLLQNLAARKDCTCLIVTHRPKALAICNRHLTVCDGRIQETELQAQ